MTTIELPIGEMIPRVLLARNFDAENSISPNKKPRTSRHYELSFYTRGNGGSLTIGSSKYDIRTGDIRFVRPGTKVNSLPGYKCMSVYFDFGQENVLYSNQILDGLPEHISTDGALQPLFEELLHSFQSGQVHAKLQQNAVLMQILAEMFALTHSRKKYCEPVRICMEYMQAHFKENVTLDALGEITGYSCLHLLRLFERDTGQTPHKWLTAMRLNQAKHLLTDSQLKIEEIAAACGFNSASHFKTLFRNQTGSTPGQYRKNINLM